MVYFNKLYTFIAGFSSNCMDTSSNSATDKGITKRPYQATQVSVQLAFPQIVHTPH